MTGLTDCEILKLPCALPSVLGVGAYLKNAVCVVQGDQAFLSPLIGSLEDSNTIRAFTQKAESMLAEASGVEALAHDWHPDFPCTRWALETGLRTIGIQHHHAHIASVMAEYGLQEPVLGLALDGYGMGEGKASWGGELLRVDPKGFTRLGHLSPLHQPGGDLAARQPWRMGAAALAALGRGAEIAVRYAAFAGAGQLGQMIQKGINAPLTTSAGRLFDAACGLLGVKPLAAFEGEAPMALEAMVTQPKVMEEGWRIDDCGVLDMRPLLEKLTNLEAEGGANLFHGTLAAALVDWIGKASAQTGIAKIALGGGCFFNKVLCQEIKNGTMGSGLTLFWPKKLPAGDTAIALGQAYAAALMLKEERR